MSAKTNIKPNLGSDGYYRKVMVYEGLRYNIKGKTLEAFYRNWDKKQRELEDGTKKRRAITVREWCDKWYATYVDPRDIGAKHKASYARTIRLHIVPYFGNTLMKDVSESDLQRLLNANADKSKSFINMLLITVKQIWYRAYKNKLIREDVSEDIKAPQAAAGTHRRITDDERRYIHQVAATHFAGPWVLMMLCLGLRPNETPALQWDRDIDFEHKTLRVNQALKSGTTVIGPPKSKAGVREIPIPDVYMPVLEKLYRQRGTIPNPPLKKDGTPTRQAIDPGEYQNTVFTQQTNLKPLTESAMRGYWASFLRALDIAMGAKVYRNQIVESKVAPDLSPYCLRHTYCTDLQDAHVPLNIAKYLMGHNSVEITAKIYTHHTKQANESARQLINAAALNPNLKDIPPMQESELCP